jgi:hypothetical protein
MKKKKPIKKSSKKKTTAANLEGRFDANEDVSDYFDIENAEMEPSGKQKVLLDLPQWSIKELDREARRQGITRQSLMKVWLIERIDQLRKPKAS